MSNSRNFRTVAPPIIALPQFALPKLQRVELDCGIQLFYHPVPSTSLIYFTTLFNGGQAEFTPAGAALLSNLRREGSHRFSPLTTSEILDINGAWIKSTFTAHHTSNSIFVLQRNIDTVLPIFLEALFRPAFPDDIFQVRRRSLAANIRTSMLDTDYRVRCSIDRLAMGCKHPLALTDTPESILSLTLSDLQSAQRYAVGAPNPPKLFITGNVTPAHIDRINVILNDVIPPNKEQTPTNQPVFEPFSPLPDKTVEIIQMPETTQCSVAMSLPAVPRTHPHFLPLHLTVKALGGYFGSRLMQTVREDLGLTYGISAQLSGYAEGSTITITADTDAKHIPNLIRNVCIEMQRLASNPPAAAELERLRQTAISSQASTLDTPYAVIDHYISAETIPLPPHYFDEKLKVSHNISSELIAHLAALYLNPQHLRIAIAGNTQLTRAEIEKIINL